MCDKMMETQDSVLWEDFGEKVYREMHVMSMTIFLTQERKSKTNKDFALYKGMTLQWQGRQDK